jgi:hypothetical protein
LNTKLSGPSKSGTWTARQSEQKGRFRLPNLRNGGKMLTTVPSYIKTTKRWHDKRIKTKQFKPGDKVLLFNSHFHLFGHGKLRSKWEGPYLVPDAADHGTVTLQRDDGDTFKANDQHLKLFLEPNPQDFEEVDVLDFLEL